MKISIIGLLLIGCCLTGFAQEREHAVWLSTSGTYKISNHWGLYIDNQFRSSNEAKYFRQFITRPGVIYNFNKNQIATVGYAYAKTNRLLDGVPDNNISENRLWEQFALLHRMGALYATQRLRLEQRNVETKGKEDVFSQRFRVYTRYLLPLKRRQESFKNGPFAALQNEIYLNVQNKNKLNGNLLDQNRTYLAFGYRISPHLDFELGAMNQYIKGLTKNTINTVGQLGIITRL